jgi:hypothetical protein
MQSFCCVVVPRTSWKLLFGLKVATFDDDDDDDADADDVWLASKYLEICKVQV